ncbi:MAG: ral secretion pathway protein [Methylobacteriaceae bacterium]|jgi:general secretion pathway protein L|nr:ral secretion pathway protein [Methylobacteriaceae bacterium]
MSVLSSIRTGFWHWIDAAAATIVAIVARLTSSRLVRVVEQPDGSLICEGEKLTLAEGGLVEPLPRKVLARLRKARVELMLLPERFVFRPLELPQRASEFLGGIVRAQIDRLTPWSAAEAAFGWTAPKELTGDRMLVTVVATSRALIAPLVASLSAHGPKTVHAVTQPPDIAGVAPVGVWDYAVGGTIDLRRVRFALASVLLVMVLAAMGSVGALLVVGDDLDAQRFEISRRIADKRASALIGREGLGSTALAALDRRKREVPSSVIVIEALSQILPDHTYLTELRVIGDRLQIVGVSRDAPALIRLIEQSSHFTRATFFAPTTRSPGEPGEHFNIEARIEPVYTPGI